MRDFESTGCLMINEVQLVSKFVSGMARFFTEWLG